MPVQTDAQRQTSLDAAGLDATQQAAVKSGSGYDNALIVTSGPARAVTADNTARLAGITAPTTTQSTSTGSAPTETKPSSGNGMYQYKTADGRTVNYGDPSLNKEALAGATFMMGPTGTEKDPLSAMSATPANGSVTGPTGHDATVAGIKDPAIATQFKGVLEGLDSQIQQAQANIDSVGQRSLNDPAATAMVNAIKQKFAVKIEAMKKKNSMVLGRAATSVAAFGGLGQMSQNFLSEQEDKATARISELQDQEEAAILKAQVAYQTQNFKDLNTAMDQYDKANKGKLDALNKLLTETNKEVTRMQAQERLDAAAEKQAVALDISKSSNLGLAIAKNIADSGITDQAQIDAYLEGVASEYGITNTDILRSAVEKARQSSLKNAASTLSTLEGVESKNIRDQLAIDKANKAPAGKKPSTKGSGVDGGFSYTGSDVDTYEAFITQGGVGPDGRQYAKQGTDTYSDPNAYVAAMNDWIANKGTAAGFVKKFPVKTYVNPKSYKLLPEAIRPNATKTTTNPV